MKNALVVVASVATVFVFSCKKDKKDNPPAPAAKTQKELIVGKWNLDNSITHSFYHGQDYRDTTRNDGSVAFFLDGKMVSYDKTGAVDDSAAYVLPKDGMLVVYDRTPGDGDTSVIQQLDAHNLKVYNKYTDQNGVDYDEDWTSMTR